MRIDPDLKLNFDDVLIRPKRSTLQSRKNVDLTREYKFKHSGKAWKGIPVVATNMDTVATIEAAKVLETYGMFTWLHKFIEPNSVNFSEIDPYWFAPTIGESKEVPYLINYAQWFLRIDVANGYRQSFIDFVKKVREAYPEITIFAGNICTPEITEELILAGADVVVVGIGGGGMCTTRTKTGIGYPQLSAVIECADAAHGLDGHIVSDGGCRTPGDVVKAFAAGADFVGLGTMLAAHDENTSKENRVYDTYWSPGTGTCYDGEEPTHARVYGMSSTEAMEKYYGGVDDHRTNEGTCTLLPYRGPIENTIKDILGGLRSACTYVGASKLKELSKRTTFIRTNQIRNDYWEKK